MSSVWIGYRQFGNAVKHPRGNTVQEVECLLGPSVTWDGKDSQRNYCDAGAYRLEGEVTFD